MKRCVDEGDEEINPRDSDGQTSIWCRNGGLLRGFLIDKLSCGKENLWILKLLFGGAVNSAHF